MTAAIIPWPSVPSGYGAPDQGGGQTCDEAEGAKNLWMRTGRYWKLKPATFNTRTLSSEVSLAELLEEFSGTAWDINGLSEVRRTGEAYTVLTNGNVLYYGGNPKKRGPGLGFLIHKDIAGNIDEFYSINESVAVVIRLHGRYSAKVVRAYAQPPVRVMKKKNSSMKVLN